MTLQELMKIEAQRQKEWDPNEKLDLSFFGNALAGEVGEACNVIKKLERERLGVPGTRADIDDLALELADVIIYIVIIANKLSIDLTKSVKVKFNQTSRKFDLQTRIPL